MMRSKGDAERAFRRLRLVFHHLCMTQKRRLHDEPQIARSGVDRRGPDPTVTFAAEAGDIFGGILQGIKDRKEREWYEKNRDEGRWDGKYFWDREDGKRYTRDEWQKELRWRYSEERAGRDWRAKRGRKAKHDNRRDDRRDRRDDRRDLRRDDRRDDRRDRRPDPRRDDRRDRRDDRRDDRR